MEILEIAGIAFVSALFATHFLRPLCLKIGLVDYPDAIRKFHPVPTPLGGGLGILVGIVLAALFAPGMGGGNLWSFLIALLPLVVVGLWDDYSSASTGVRVAAQIVAALAMVYVGGVVIRYLGDLTGDGSAIVLHRWAVPFTVFCVVGVINSVNMIDGIDGLAGSVAIVALAWFAAAGAIQGAGADVVLAFILIGAVAGFLVFNFRHPFRERASVYLGDTGSMVLGFALVWLSVRLTQAESGALPPMAAVWVIGLPLLDSLAVIVRRIAKGQNPLSADRDHLHFVLLRAGLSPRRTVAVLLTVAAAFGAVGIGTWRFGVPESVLFYGALAVYAVYLAVMIRVWKVMGAMENAANAEQ